MWDSFNILRRSTFRSPIKKLKVQSPQCYILGNGPSLNEDLIPHMSFFRDQNVFVVNFFALTETFKTLQPKYYILADPCFFIKSKNEELQKRSDHLMNHLKEKCNWPIILIVPFPGVNTISCQLRGNKNIRIIGFNGVSCRKAFKWFDRWVHNQQWAIFSGIDVTAVAIYLAMMVGFKEINLLGVDHSAFKNITVGPDNEIYEKIVHFYDNNELKPQPIMWEENNRFRYLKLHEYLGYTSKTFETYHYIREYAEYKKVKVYNRCKVSYIDAFERRIIEEK